MAKNGYRYIHGPICIKNPPTFTIYDIVNCLGNLTDCSLYVDDFCICYRSKSMATIERQLQQNLNKIENWATSNGFKFSKSKTQCVHFCQLRKQHDDPVLHLYGSPIPVVEESKFLGILFDRKLSFIPHIKYLKAKCLKALDLLKVLSHTSWGADRTTLLKVSKVAKIRNRYNQVPHLTQDTNGKVTNSQKTPQTRAKRSALSQQVTTKHK